MEKYIIWHLFLYFLSRKIWANGLQSLFEWRYCFWRYGIFKFLELVWEISFHFKSQNFINVLCQLYILVYTLVTFKWCKYHLNWVYMKKLFFPEVYHMPSLITNIWNFNNILEAPKPNLDQELNHSTLSLEDYHDIVK